MTMAASSGANIFQQFWNRSAPIAAVHAYASGFVPKETWERVRFRLDFAMRPTNHSER
jgi:hypothetical protein